MHDVSFVNALLLRLSEPAAFKTYSLMRAASRGETSQKVPAWPSKRLSPSRQPESRRIACRAQVGEMRILAIPGSLRKASTNNGLLRAAVKVAPPGMQIAMADISQMPLYNDDLWQSGVPQSVTTFRDEIEAADALLFSVPEYNYSLPGPLKNAIDWASHPNVFAGKPATMIGAGGGYGTGVGQLHLRQCAAWLEIQFLIKPSIQIHRFTEQDVFDEKGDLTSEKWEQRLRTQLEALQQWTKQLQATPIA